MLVPEFITIFDSDLMSKVLAWKQINILVVWPTFERVVLSLCGLQVDLDL